MRRKIPARKHHGIRDPIKQNEQRLAKIKDKINNPPEKDQHISYKLSQFIKLKNDLKNGNFKNIKKSLIGGNNEDKPKKHRQSNQQQQNNKRFKTIRKLPNETDEDYLKRVNRITTESLKESQYELKYGVNVVRNSKTGEIKIEKRPKNEIDEILEKKKHKKNKSNRINKQKIDPKLSKELIKQVLNEEKEEKKLDESKEFRRDIIKFGEVVHAPPTLSLPRKAQKIDTVPRPGKKNNLLLKNLLNNGVDPEKNESTDISSKTQLTKSKSVVDLKGKRKDLPTATRLMIEDQQNKVIQMYRQLKKNKMKV